MLCTQAAFASALLAWCGHGKALAQPALVDVALAEAEIADVQTMASAHAGCHESLPTLSSAPVQDESVPESGLQCRVQCLSATQTLDKPKPLSLPALAALDMPLALPGTDHVVTLTANHTLTLHSALPWPPPACRNILQRSHRLLI